MNRRRLSITGFYVLGPVVAVLVVASFWLVFLAMAENSRLGRATEQIVSIVGAARYMYVSPNVTSERASIDFFEQIGKNRAFKLVQLAPSATDPVQSTAFVDPWGSAIKVRFWPSDRLFSTEMAVSSSVCRKILLFYAKDIQGLGIKRVEVKEYNSEQQFWRVIYEEGKANYTRGLSAEGISANCGDNVENLLKLTFSL